MGRIPSLVLGAAGVLLTAGLSAVVTMGGSLGATAALGAGAVAAIVGVTLSTRWAKTHLPFLRTFAMELSAERDECHGLRTELKQRRMSGGPSSWDEWQPRIEAWDKSFWKLLEDRLPDLWKVYRREQPVILEDYGERWAVEVMGLLDRRLALIKQLLEREHGG